MINITSAVWFVGLLSSCSGGARSFNTFYFSANTPSRKTAAYGNVFWYGSGERKQQDEQRHRFDIFAFYNYEDQRPMIKDRVFLYLANVGKIEAKIQKGGKASIRISEEFVEHDPNISWKITRSGLTGRFSEIRYEKNSSDGMYHRVSVTEAK